MTEKGSMKNRILGILENLCDYIELGVLCALCALPVLTLFSSVSAACYTKQKCFEEGRAGIAGTFFHYLKENLGKEMLTEVFFLLYLVPGLVGVLAADELLSAGRISTSFAVIRWLWFVPGLLVFPWIVTYEARFNDGIAAVYRKSFLLFLSHPGASLCMASGLCVLFLVGRFFIALIIFLPIPWLFLLARFTEPVYRELIRKNGEANSFSGEKDGK